jgi:hypothetical protein
VQRKNGKKDFFTLLTAYIITAQLPQYNFPHTIPEIAEPAFKAYCNAVQYPANAGFKF